MGTISLFTVAILLIGKCTPFSQIFSLVYDASSNLKRKFLNITWSDEDASSNSDSDGKHFEQLYGVHYIDYGLEDKLMLSFCKPTILCWRKRKYAK